MRFSTVVAVSAVTLAGSAAAYATSLHLSLQHLTLLQPSCWCYPSRESRRHRDAIPGSQTHPQTQPPRPKRDSRCPASETTRERTENDGFLLLDRQERLLATLSMHGVCLTRMANSWVVRLGPSPLRSRYLQILASSPLNPPQPADNPFKPALNRAQPAHTPLNQHPLLGLDSATAKPGNRPRELAPRAHRRSSSRPANSGNMHRRSTTRQRPTSVLRVRGKPRR